MGLLPCPWKLAEKRWSLANRIKRLPSSSPLVFTVHLLQKDEKHNKTTTENRAQGYTWKRREACVHTDPRPPYPYFPPEKMGEGAPSPIFSWSEGRFVQRLKEGRNSREWTLSSQLGIESERTPCCYADQYWMHAQHMPALWVCIYQRATNCLSIRCVTSYAVWLASSQGFKNSCLKHCSRAVFPGILSCQRTMRCAINRQRYQKAQIARTKRSLKM